MWFKKKCIWFLFFSSKAIVVWHFLTRTSRMKAGYYWYKLTRVYFVLRVHYVYQFSCFLSLMFTCSFECNPIIILYIASVMFCTVKCTTENQLKSNIPAWSVPRETVDGRTKIQVRWNARAKNKCPRKESQSTNIKKAKRLEKPFLVVEETGNVYRFNIHI